MATAVETLLLKNTGLTEDQLNGLLAMHAGDSTLRDVLSKKEGATADELISELCSRLGISYLKEIPVNDIPIDLIRNIPINFAKKQEVLPLREEANQVFVLTTNPLNQKILDDLRVLFKKRTVAVMTTKNQLCKLRRASDN